MIKFSMQRSVGSFRNIKQLMTLLSSKLYQSFFQQWILQYYMTHGWLNQWMQRNWSGLAHMHTYSDFCVEGGYLSLPLRCSRVDCTLAGINEHINTWTHPSSFLFPPSFSHSTFLSMSIFLPPLLYFSCLFPIVSVVSVLFSPLNTE